MRAHRTLVLSVVLCALAAGSAIAQIDARMLRYPDVSATQIAFTYAGDIWLVPRAGGLANRLSTPRGQEVFPRFSPDGKEIAYSANYDGNLDVYIIPTEGGLPRRITHHPETDRIAGWFPDGKSVLVASAMASPRDRFSELYRVPRAGGLPTRLPLPYGEFGAISPDGRLIAYTPIATDFRTWKRYRGGMASQIWIFDLEKKTSKRLPVGAGGSNDSMPMWHGRTLYFLSDRDEAKRANIWAYDMDRNTFRQVTMFRELDVRFPSIGPADIVFENGDRLYLLDLATEKVAEVPVTVVTDRATLRPHAVNAAKLIQSATISPAGKRVVFEARGDIFSVPAEHGVVLDLTRTSGVAERYPAWSPDGKWIAYFSDRSGEYELTLRPWEGKGDEKKVTSLGAGFRYRIWWAPDSTRVAFIDQAMVLSIADVSTGKVTRVDKGLFLYQGDLDAFQPSWSPDSRWLAWAWDTPARNGAVFLYDTKADARKQATSDFYSYAQPVFDPEGKYLYVLTSRTFSPIYSDLDDTWIYANTTNIGAIPLRKDVPSPLAARDDSDEAAKAAEAKKDKDDGKDGAKDKAADAKAGKDKDKVSAADSGDAKKDAGKDAKDGKDAKKKPPKPVEIDLDGFEQRLVLLPPAAGNYAGLAAVKGKILYLRLPATGSGEETKSLRYYDLEEREEKTILASVDGYELAAEGQKALVRQKETWAIIDVKPDQKLEKKLVTDTLDMVVDPPAEWRQIFEDVWRFERDYFYDPNMHGVDWKGMKARYGKLLDDAVTRWDVNFVLGELIAELNASHTYRGGGDLEQPVERGVGLLGADFALENGAYRIKKIIDGAVWDAEVRSPLRRPGVDVKEGDYLLGVNHAPVDTSVDPWAAFEGLAGRTVVLTVNAKPTLDGARDVLVETLGSEGRLRNLAWIEEHRKRVDAASGGRTGYVYVPDTGRGGQNELVRQFRAQITKDALIIDERFNSGGQIPNRFIELLNRPLLNYWGVRDGADWPWPPVAQTGPKVMLINGWSGSGGDAFPFYFKEAGLGPLIGTRTWGGLIGITGAPPLIDGGTVTVPTFGIYSTKGEWIIEGHGVEPDIEVVDDPALMTDGTDPQLERAITEINRLLRESPPKRPARPAYPKRAGY